jgi:hypothetical protein
VAFVGKYFYQLRFVRSSSGCITNNKEGQMDIGDDFQKYFISNSVRLSCTCCLVLLRVSFFKLFD